MEEDNNVRKIKIGNVEEYIYLADISGVSGLKISFVLRYSAKSPIIRFKYILSSKIPHRLTKINKQDKLTYLSCEYGGESTLKEIRFSEFYENIHSYKLGEYAAFEYDTQLKTKLARDNESSEMLDIIFANRTYSLPQLYDWGGMITTIQEMLRAKNRNFVSSMDKIEPRITKDIEKTINAFDSN